MSDLIIDHTKPKSAPQTGNKFAEQVAEGRVFCRSAECPLCRPNGRFSHFIRVAISFGTYNRLSQYNENASAFIRRLILADLHRPEPQRVKRRKRKKKKMVKSGKWEFGIIQKYVRVTEEMRLELKRRRLSASAYAGKLIQQEFRRNRKRR